jgi:hypothetical protein
MRSDVGLRWLMAAHTAVVLVSISAIAYALWRGLTGWAGAADPWLLAALAWPAVIGAGLALNRGQCVMQSWARRLSGVDGGWARDMLWVPETWAVRIPQVFTPPYLVAVGLCVGRWLELQGP